jgi:hypothetical protein
MARPRLWGVAPWAAGAVLGILIAHFAERVHTVQADEVLTINASRSVISDPLSALNPSVNLTGRGFERGMALLFGAVQWGAGDTAHAFWVQKAICALLFALVVPIIAAWGRDLGLRRWQALVAGVSAVCVPWMVLGTSLLNSEAAYPLTSLALWAMWRATVRPGPLRDVLALLALVLLAVFRVSNLIVAVAWPVAILVYTLHARQPPRRVMRDHVVLVAGLVLGLVVLAIKGRGWFVGAYPVSAPSWSVLHTYLRILLAYLAIGTAIVPAVLALAFVARSLVRPQDAAAAAFAAIGAVSFLAIVYVTATSGYEERYIAPMAPVVLLMAMIAVARRSVGPLAVLVAGIVVARVVALTGPGSDVGPYGFFSQPAQSFFRRVILLKLSRVFTFDHHILTTVLLAAVAAAVLAVVLARRRPQLVYGVTAAIVVLYGLVAGAYSLKKFSTQAGIPNLTFAQQSWIDRAVGTHASVAFAPLGLENVQNELIVFNRSLGSTFQPPRVPLEIDHATGAIKGLRRYLLVQDGLLAPDGIGGRSIATSSYLPVTARLIQPSQRALWHLTSPRTVRVFATGDNDCLGVTLVQPDGVIAHQRFEIGGARGVLTGSPLYVLVRLPTGRVNVDLRLHGGGKATIVALGRGPCS